MYRCCPECGSVSWWPAKAAAGACGHQLDPALTLGVPRAAACPPESLRVGVRHDGAGVVAGLRSGQDAALGAGLTLQLRVAKVGVLAVRAVSMADGVGVTSHDHRWTPLLETMPMPLHGVVESEVSGWKLELSLADLPDSRSPGRESLPRLAVGSGYRVESDPEGHLVHRQDGTLLAVPREDNCLHLVSSDASRYALNGIALTAAVVRRGDILRDATHAWKWAGVETGFVAAPPAGSFRVSGEGVSLAGRAVGLTCAFASGQLTLVFGASGSGKTTLVRLMSGILTPDDGTIHLEGHRSTGGGETFPPSMLEAFTKRIRPAIAFIPQDHTVLPDLTVRQSLECAYLLHPANRSRAARKPQAIARRVDDLLVELGLDDHQQKLVEILSGGQRCRLNMAIGLVGDPQLFILDEPTSGLDFINEQIVMRLLRRLAHQGRAVVVVTHSFPTLRFADQCLVVRPGAEGAQVAATVVGREEIGRAETTVAKLVASAKPTVARARQRLQSGRPGRRRALRPFLELVARCFRQWLTPSVGGSRVGRFIGEVLPIPLRTLLAFVLLPLVLGVMIRLGTGMRRDERLAIGLVAIFWLGVNQSVRDLLRDIDVIRREDLDGTPCIWQVLARASFGASVSLVAAVMMTAPFHWMTIDGWRPALDTTGQYSIAGGDPEQVRIHWWTTIAYFWAAGTLGSCTGLAIAGACSFAKRKAESIAVLASVLVTLPQFLFSELCLPGGLADKPEHYGRLFSPWHEGADEVADLLSFFTVTRWTFLPLNARLDGVEGTRIEWMSAIMLTAGAIATLIVAWCTLAISTAMDRGSGWLPRRPDMRPAAPPK